MSAHPQPKCHKCGRTVHEVGRVVRANAVGEMPAVWSCPGECATPAQATDSGEALREAVRLARRYATERSHVSPRLAQVLETLANHAALAAPRQVAAAEALSLSERYAMDAEGYAPPPAQADDRAEILLARALNAKPTQPGDTGRGEAAQAIRLALGARLAIGASEEMQAAFMERCADVIRRHADTLLVALDAAPQKVEWLRKDDAEQAIWQAIKDIRLGNPTDDKLIVANLRERGIWLARYGNDLANWCEQGDQ
jgi:hypothetical protein